jgi:hypothetical protein
VRDAKGRKLSKSDQAPPLDQQHPTDALETAWRFLFPDHPLSSDGDLQVFWELATARWDMAGLRPEIDDDHGTSANPL